MKGHYYVDGSMMNKDMETTTIPSVARSAISIGTIYHTHWHGYYATQTITDESNEDLIAIPASITYLDPETSPYDNVIALSAKSIYIRNELIVPITEGNQHVGIAASWDGRLYTDIARKAARIKAPSTPLINNVMRNPLVHNTTQLKVRNSHALTAGKYDTALQVPTKSETRIFASLTIDEYRVTCNAFFCQPSNHMRILSDNEVPIDLNGLTPFHCLRFVKIGLLE